MVAQPLLTKRSPRGLWLPGGQPQIDWSNPVTAGLVGCWVTTGEGGTVPVIRDLVSNSLLTSVGSPSFRNSKNGLIADNNNSASGWSGLLTPNQQISKSVSVLWFGINQGLPASEAFPSPYIGAYYNTASGNDIAWGLFHPTTANLRFYYGSATGSAVVGGFPTAGVPTAIVGSYQFGGNFYIFANGSQKVSGSAGSSSVPSWTNNVIRLNLSVDGASYCNTQMSVAALWNRSLSVGESALISADPTNFLTFPGDLIRSFFGPGLPTLHASLSLTQGAETIAAHGVVSDHGALARTQGAETIAAHGVVSDRGSLIRTQTAQTASAHGVVSAHGSLAGTQDAQIVAARAAATLPTEPVTSALLAALNRTEMPATTSRIRMA